MTRSYKIGDKVLVEMIIDENLETDYYTCEFRRIDVPNEYFLLKVNEKQLHPLTPKPEFEYSEIVEVSNTGEKGDWYQGEFVCYIQHKSKRFYLCRMNHTEDTSSSYVNEYFDQFNFCRKLQSRETITHNDKVYDKEQFENAIKDLKEVGV